MRHVNYQVDGWIVGYELKINVDTRQISRETHTHRAIMWIAAFV